MGDKTLMVVFAGILLLVGVVFVVIFGLTLRVWIRAKLGGVRIGILDVLGMRLRGNPPGLIVDTLLTLRRRGVDSSIAEVEKVYIAHKGQPFTPSELADLVVQRRSGIELSA